MCVCVSCLLYRLFVPPTSSLVTASLLPLLPPQQQAEQRLRASVSHLLTSALLPVSSQSPPPHLPLSFSPPASRVGAGAGRGRGGRAGEGGRWWLCMHCYQCCCLVHNAGVCIRYSTTRYASLANHPRLHLLLHLLLLLPLPLLLLLLLPLLQHH